MPRAKIDVVRLASTLAMHGINYITVNQLAAMLGVSTRTAGRILAEMQRRGLAEKWSRRTYKLSLQRLVEVTSCG